MCRTRRWCCRPCSPAIRSGRDRPIPPFFSFFSVLSFSVYIAWFLFVLLFLFLLAGERCTHLGSGSYPDRGSVAYDSHQNALPTYLLRAPIARLRAPPTYLFPGRAAKRKIPVPGAFAGAADPGAATAGAAAAPVSAGVPAAGDSSGMAPFRG